MSGETGRDGLQFLHQTPQLPELFVFSDEDEYPPTQDAMKLLYVTASQPQQETGAVLGCGGCAVALVRDIRCIKGSRSRCPWNGYVQCATRATRHHRALVCDHAAQDAWCHAPSRHFGSSADPQSASDARQCFPQVKQQLVEARRGDSQAQLWPEVAVDIIGEDYQRVGDVKNAIEIFQLNLLAYPDSADANDTLLAPIWQMDRRSSRGNTPRRHWPFSIQIKPRHRRGLIPIKGGARSATARSKRWHK